MYEIWQTLLYYTQHFGIEICRTVILTPSIHLVWSELSILTGRCSLLEFLWIDMFKKGIWWRILQIPFIECITCNSKKKFIIREKFLVIMFEN